MTRKPFLSSVKLSSCLLPFSDAVVDNWGCCVLPSKIVDGHGFHIEFPSLVACSPWIEGPRVAEVEVVDARFDRRHDCGYSVFDLFDGITAFWSQVHI